MIYAIEVKDLKKSYGDLKAVDGLSFDVKVGEIFGLLGPNGAGKTTTMECIEGIRKYDGGNVKVLSLDPDKDQYALQPKIGVQLQQAELQKRIKVKEAIRLYSKLYENSKDISEIIAKLGLESKTNSRFMTLSGGQKQRLFIALALIHDPEVLFFDELTTGLDPQARHTIWDIVKGLKSEGKTVFMTTHLMEEAERLCDRVAIIDHGKIIDIDTPDNLISKHCKERKVIIKITGQINENKFKKEINANNVELEGELCTVHDDKENLEIRILNYLNDNNVKFSDFRSISPTLEDVFLKITGHGIREES